VSETWSADFVNVGSYSYATRHVEKTVSPEWDDVLALSQERIPAPF
jgi:hypothetical protein